MGLKDKIMEKMMGKMLKTMSGIDMKKIQQDASNGKYDIAKLMGTMEGLLGKKSAKSLMSKIQDKVKSGEKISISSVMSMLKDIDTTDIKQKAESGNLDLEGMKNTMADIIGKDKANEVINQAQELAQNVKEDDIK